jgi:hypothetical protein
LHLQFSISVLTSYLSTDLGECQPSQEGQTTVALTSLGLKPEAIQALARKSSIIQSQLRSVANEKQMLSCIAQNFPAVGYFDGSTETETIQPCF